MSKSFIMKRQVQFAETDMAGVLHFSNYYRYMEEAEHVFWRSLGISVLTRIDDHEISWPRVVTSCEYLKPVHFEDELELTVKIIRLGDRSIIFAIEFDRGGERIASGRIKAVCCTMAEGKFQSISIPGSIRKKLEAVLEVEAIN